MSTTSSRLISSHSNRAAAVEIASHAVELLYNVNASTYPCVQLMLMSFCYLLSIPEEKRAKLVSHLVLKLGLFTAAMEEQAAHCCCFCSSSDGNGAGLVAFSVRTRQMYAHLNCVLSGVEFALERSTELLQCVEQAGLEGCTTALSSNYTRLLEAQEQHQQCLALWRRTSCIQCTYCSRQHATLSCAVKGCSCSAHLPCIPATSTLIAVPLIAVRLRPSWIWLCPAHNRGDCNSELYYTEALPTPRTGKVCISVEDVSEKQCEALVELGIALPVGLAAASAAEGSRHEQTVIFADDSSVVVPIDALLLPLQLPTFLPNEPPESVQQQSQQQQQQQQQAVSVAHDKQHVEQPIKQEQQQQKPSKQKAAAAAVTAAERRPKASSGRPAASQGEKRDRFVCIRSLCRCFTCMHFSSRKSI
jgi:hypothetical protein